MAEFVVAPKNDMIVPMLKTGNDIAVQLAMMTSVHTTFFTPENFFPLTSSIESLVGRTQNGAAKRTTKHIPKSDMYITIGVWPFRLYGAYRILDDLNIFAISSSPFGSAAKAT